jgi:hypothetical protein
MKQINYINEPIVKSQDVGEPRMDDVFKVYNYLMQKAKPKFFFTVQFFTMSEDSKKPKNVKNMKGYNDDDSKPEYYMKLTYMSHKPSYDYNPSSSTENIVNQEADDFAKAIIEGYKNEFGEPFPFKFERFEKSFSETCGFRQLRYLAPMIFKLPK